MPAIHIHDLVHKLRIPIDSISIEGNIVHIGTIGTCLIEGNKIIEPSLKWEKIYELNKEKLADLIYAMYQTKVDELEITPKPDRVLELKFKGTEVYLPSVQYSYLSKGEWTLQRTSLR